MDYLAKVSKDIVAARKARDSVKVKALIMLKSKLVDNVKAVKPKEESAVIKSYMKQVGESLDAYLANSEKYTQEILDARAESAIIKLYLPEEVLKYSSWGYN